MCYDLDTPAGEPSVVLAFDDRGVLQRRVVIPGVEEAGAFAVDPARRRLYLTPGGEASLLALDLPAR